MEQKWRLIVAAGLGILAAALIYVFLQPREDKVEVQQLRVVMAAQDIPQGMVINDQMLAFQPVPEKFIQPGALGSKGSVIGSTAAVNIMAGEQIVVTKLTSPQRVPSLANRTPPGKRAVTINLERASAVGGMLMPGDHVDLLASFTQPPLNITLFQDVLVLAVGQEMLPEQAGKRRGEKKAGPTREAVTLALSPKEMQILAVAIGQSLLPATVESKSL